MAWFFVALEIALSCQPNIINCHCFPLVVWAAMSLLLVNKPSQSRLIAESLFLIAVKWKNVMGPSHSHPLQHVLFLLFSKNEFVHPDLLPVEQSSTRRRKILIYSHNFKSWSVLTSLKSDPNSWNRCCLGAALKLPSPGPLTQ